MHLLTRHPCNFSLMWAAYHWNGLGVFYGTLCTHLRHYGRIWGISGLSTVLDRCTIGKLSLCSLLGKGEAFNLPSWPINSLQTSSWPLC
jgi:hypothetical protein